MHFTPGVIILENETSKAVRVFNNFTGGKFNGYFYTFSVNHCMWLGYLRLQVTVFCFQIVVLKLFQYHGTTSKVSCK